MLAGRGSPTSAASLATGREPAQRARRSPPTSPQSQVASWLRETAGVLAPPPSHAAASQHSAACTDLQQASLPLGADAALISPPRGSGSGSRRTLVSRRSSAVVAAVLDFTKNLSNSLLQLTNQLQTDAINREDKMIEREDKLLQDAVSREDKLLAEVQAQRQDAMARERDLIASANTSEERIIAGTVARENKLLATTQATEERLLADARAREHSLAQMKVNSERLQAEFANKRESVYIETELKRQKLAVEKDVAIERDRNEAMVKKDLTVLQANERRNLESARERETLRHEERGEAEERLRQRLRLESQLAEQKMKVALLEKQSEFEKREATLEKELLARDLESRSRLLLSQSQQTSPKTDEREGLTPLIDIEESGSPPSDYSLPCSQNRPHSLTRGPSLTQSVVDEGMSDPGRCPTLATYMEASD